MKATALGIIVISGVFYQLCARSIPEDTDPFIPLLCTYAIAFLTTLILSVCNGSLGHLAAELKKVNASAFLLGAVICFYELGFILAYRHGFGITTLPPIANIAVIVAVCLVGVLFCGEHISLLHYGGLLLAVGGIAITML